MTTVRRTTSTPPAPIHTPPPQPARSARTNTAQPAVDSFEPAKAGAAAAATLASATLDESAVRALVGGAYQTWLRRAPEPAGQALWTAAAMDKVRAGWTQEQIQSWLDGQFGQCVERQALLAVDQVFASELGRDVSDSCGWWHDQAVSWARDQGIGLEEVRARLTAGIREGEEYRTQHIGELVKRAFQEELGRPGGEGFWTDKARELVAQGMPTSEIESYLRGQFRSSDEYRNNLVKRVFQEELGRPGVEGFWMDKARELAQQGQSLAEIESYLRAQFRASEEYGLQRVDALVPQIFEEEMGRPAGQGDWTNWAKEQLHRGMSLDQTASLLRTRLRESEEYRTQRIGELVKRVFQEELGRPGGEGFWTDKARELVAQGMPTAEIESYLRSQFRSSDEYRLSHLDQIVADCYRQLLGRGPDSEGMSHFLQVAEQLKGQGKMPSEIAQAISDEIRASPEYQQKQGGRWVGKVPEINQLGPAGNDGSYWNGSSNCGPTSLAMVARAVGWGGHLTDAQLVMEMYRRAGTNGSAGTGVNGINDALRSIGLSTEVHWVNTDVEGMAQALRDGKMIVANGDFYALGVPGRANTSDAGHYIVIEGLDSAGNFIVNEPWGGGQYNISPQNIYRFLAEWPGGPGGNWIATWP